MTSAKQPNFTSSSHYAVLGLEPNATEAEISKAYKKLALQYHPDKNITDKDKVENIFNRVKLAYECLRNPEARMLYDLRSVPPVMVGMPCGTAVALRGMIDSANPERQGRRGIIVGVDRQCLKYEVQVDGETRVMLIESDRLGRLADALGLPNGTPCHVNGLENAKEHDNKAGIIVGVDVFKAKYEVQLQDVKLLLKPENIIKVGNAPVPMTANNKSLFIQNPHQMGIANVMVPCHPVGTAVTVAGLAQTPHHNGKTGAIHGYDHQTGKYTVKIDLESLHLLIGPDHLIPVSTITSSTRSESELKQMEKKLQEQEELLSKFKQQLGIKSGEDEKDKFGFELNHEVTWTGDDEDVPEGSVGTVVGFTEDRVRVKFPNGTWTFIPAQLQILGFAIDDEVCWTFDDSDVPAGSVGTIIAFVEDRVRVKFPNGVWTFKPSELVHVIISGSWTCNKCSESNKGERQQCNNCNAARRDSTDKDSVQPGAVAQDSLAEYAIGRQVEILRSDGSWAVGQVTQFQDGMVTVSGSWGKKFIPAADLSKHVRNPPLDTHRPGPESPVEGSAEMRSKHDLEEQAERKRKSEADGKLRVDEACREEERQRKLEQNEEKKHRATRALANLEEAKRKWQADEQEIKRKADEARKVTRKKSEPDVKHREDEDKQKQRNKAAIEETKKKQESLRKTAEDIRKRRDEAARKVDEVAKKRKDEEAARRKAGAEEKKRTAQEDLKRKAAEIREASLKLTEELKEAEEVDEHKNDVCEDLTEAADVREPVQASQSEKGSFDCNGEQAADSLVLSTETPTKAGNFGPTPPRPLNITGWGQLRHSESPSRSFDSAVTKLSNSLKKMQSSPSSPTLRTSNAPAPQMPTRMTSAPRSSSLQEQGGLVINEHVAWTSPDVDLPKGITGIVVGFKDDLVQVKFIKDVFSIKETDLRRVLPRPPPAESRLLASPKSTYWQDAQKSTPKALHVPLTLAEESPSAPVEMKSGFASPKPHGNGTMQFKHEQFGFSISDQVVWTKSDADVPEGAVGVVIGFTSNRVQVMFPLGTFNFQPEELEKSRPVPHVHSLSISARPSDASVLAPPTAVEKFGFLLHEWVEWTKSDVDVPKGSIGMIIGFTADRVQVRFPRHTFNLKPNELVKIPRHAGPSSSLQAINAAIAGTPRAIGYLSTP
jgi:ribosomal protein L21E